jgi:regulator of sirC expression with transglutaminase-like and TPR domain
MQKVIGRVPSIPMDPSERFATIVRGRDDSIPLDEATLCISACMQPDVDVDEWCARIDDLSARCAESTFEAVRDHLFTVAGFAGDTEDYGDPRNSFLDAVIGRRRGIPITLSVLFMEVARRHDVAVSGIGMPGHFLVQERGATDRWCDPFHGGVMLDWDDCARLFSSIHGDARRLGPHDLEPTPARAIVARVLANLEHGRLGRDPSRLASLCSLHLAIPDVPIDQQVQLLRGLAAVGEPEVVARAYEEVAAAAPEDVAGVLRADAARARSRWN